MDVQHEYNIITSMSRKNALKHLEHLATLFSSLSNEQKIRFSMDFLILKQMLDINNERDLHEIVYDSPMEEIRSLLQMINHISIFYNENYTRKYHILTDIDDTLIPHPSALHKIQGTDYSDIKGMPYSGILEFYKDLPNTFDSYTTILTATPRILKKSRRSNHEYILGKYAFLQGYDKINDALGSLTTVNGVFTVNSVKVAYIKFERFLQYRLLFPEYKFIFIGDNGQGDLLAGQQMLKIDPTCLVFIHNIINKDGTYKMTEDEVFKASIEYSGRLYIFNDYCHLARLFERCSLWSKYIVEKVQQAYQNDRKTRRKRLS